MPEATTDIPADTVVVLDFETSGLSPNQGGRAIEIGAVKIVAGTVVERFQSLMNPGFPISGFISSYTGITNAMLRHAPPCHEVMEDFHRFVGDHNLVAHNASFDRSFLDAEFAMISKRTVGSFSCSMLLSRRLMPEAPNHKLETLVRHLRIEADGSFHRALYDAEMAGKIWMALLERIAARTATAKVSFSFADTVCKVAKPKVDALLRAHAQAQTVVHPATP